MHEKWWCVLTIHQLRFFFSPDTWEENFDEKKEENMAQCWSTKCLLQYLFEMKCTQNIHNSFDVWNCWILVGEIQKKAKKTYELMDATKAFYCREWRQIREYKAGYCILLSVTAFCSLRPRFSLFDTAFLGTNKHLYEWVCPSVHRSARRSVSILAFSFLAVSTCLLAPRGQYCRVYGLIS